MLFKDWVTLLISIVALLISALTAYFNLFLQTDDLSVLLEGYTKYDLDTKAKKLIPHPDYMVTLVNAGNRASSISRIYFSSEQLKGEDRTSSCDEVAKSWTTFQVEPFVVKPGDVLIKKLNYNAGQWFENFHGEWNQNKVTILTCLGFSVVAPDSRRQTITVEADRLVFDVKAGLPVLTEDNFDADRQPVSLLKNWKARVSGLGLQ